MLGDIAEASRRGRRKRGGNVEADGRGKDDDGGARYGKEARVRSLVTGRHHHDDDDEDDNDEDEDEDEDGDNDEDDEDDDGGGEDDEGKDEGRRERRVHGDDNNRRDK